MSFRGIISAIAAAIVSLGAATTSFALAPLDTASNPKSRIIDSFGRILYSIDLSDDALNGHPNQVPVAARQRFHERHSNRAVALGLALEQQYGFQHVGMTSWVGLSISAYLTPAQLARVRANPLVTLVSEATEWKLDATPAPPWQERSANGETYSWGRAAVGGISAPETQNVTIYIVDAGVGQHSDLRVGGYLSPRNFVMTVGCYPHATHVAGIIAANFQNSLGVAGIFAGASFISVSVASQNKFDAAGNGICAAPTSDSTVIADALDTIKWDMSSRAPGRAAIVNMSLSNSDGRYSPGGTINAKMANLARPDATQNYAGAFIAQAAGNYLQDACAYAYSENGQPNPADGIMVVGGIDSNGAKAQPFNNSPFAANEPGSNGGRCVEIWAPSLNILSTWGPTVGYVDNDPTTWQRQGTTYNNYIRLSGTSMAAPHVAGVAAAILQQQPTLRSTDIEVAVRNAMLWRGAVDPMCSCAMMLAVNPVASTLDDLVEHSYAAILARGSDPGGKAFYLDEIERLRRLGMDPRQSLRAMNKQFFFSGEYGIRNRINQDFVSDLYQAYNFRAPDSGGLSYWLGQMSQGLNREAMVTSFANGAEYDQNMTSRLGSSMERAEVTLDADGYRGAFGRLPDTGGFTFYRGYLRQAQCSGNYGTVNSAANSFVSALFNSAEYAGRGHSDAQFVADLYDVFFHHYVDVGGFNYWVSQVPALGRQGVMNYFFSSQEWANRISQITSQQPCMQ